MVSAPTGSCDLLICAARRIWSHLLTLWPCGRPAEPYTMALYAGRTAPTLFMVRPCSLAGQIIRSRAFLPFFCGSGAGRRVTSSLMSCAVQGVAPRQDQGSQRGSCERGSGGCGGQTACASEKERGAIRSSRPAAEGPFGTTRPEGSAQFPDPDSRIMKDSATRSFAQCYKCFSVRPAQERGSAGIAGAYGG